MGGSFPAHFCAADGASGSLPTGCHEATQALGGGATLTMQGDRAMVTLQGVDPTALARWLQQVRINARVLPITAKLQRNGSPAQWSGQIVLGGPGLGTTR